MSRQPEYLRLIDEPSGKRCDATPLFADGAAFAALVDDLLALFSDTPFDAIAGIDALGFVLGGALAVRAGCGFVAVRKGGELAVAADRVEFVDYSGEKKSLGSGAAPSRLARAYFWSTSGSGRARRWVQRRR